MLGLESASDLEVNQHYKLHYLVCYSYSIARIPPQFSTPKMRMLTWRSYFRNIPELCKQAQNLFFITGDGNTVCHSSSLISIEVPLFDHLGTKSVAARREKKIWQKFPHQNEQQAVGEHNSYRVFQERQRL